MGLFTPSRFSQSFYCSRCSMADHKVASAFEGGKDGMGCFSYRNRRTGSFYSRNMESVAVLCQQGKTVGRCHSTSILWGMYAQKQDITQRPKAKLTPHGLKRLSPYTICVPKDSGMAHGHAPSVPSEGQKTA